MAIREVSVPAILSKIRSEEERLGKKIACPVEETLYKELMEATAKLLIERRIRTEGFRKIPFVCLVNFLYRRFEVFAQWESFLDELKKLSMIRHRRLSDTNLIAVELDKWIREYVEETNFLFALVENTANLGKPGWITEFCRVLASRPKKGETKAFRALVEKTVRWLWKNDRKTTIDSVEFFCKSEGISPEIELKTTTYQAAIEMLLNAALDLHATMALMDQNPSLLESERLFEEVASRIGVHLRNYFVDDSSFRAFYQDLRFPRELDPTEFVKLVQARGSIKIVSPGGIELDPGSLDSDTLVLGEYEVSLKGFSGKCSVIPDVAVRLEALEVMLREGKYFAEAHAPDGLRWIFIATGQEEARVEIIDAPEGFPQELEHMRTIKLDSKSFKKWVHSNQTHLVCVHPAHPGIFRIWFRSRIYYSILKRLMLYPNPPKLDLGKSYELRLRIGAIAWTGIGLATFGIQTSDHSEETTLKSETRYVGCLLDIRNFLTKPAPQLVVAVKALGEDLGATVSIPPIFLISSSSQLVEPTGDTERVTSFREKYALFVHNSIASNQIQSSVPLEKSGSVGAYDFYIPIWDARQPLKIVFGQTKWMLRPSFDIQLSIHGLKSELSNGLSMRWHCADGEISVVEKTGSDLYVDLFTIPPSERAATIEMKRHGIVLIRKMVNLRSEVSRITLGSLSKLESGLYDIDVVVNDQVISEKVAVSPTITFKNIPKVVASDSIRIPFESSHPILAKGVVSQEFELSAQSRRSNLVEYRGRAGFLLDNTVVFLDLSLLLYRFDVYSRAGIITGVSLPNVPVKISFGRNVISTLTEADGTFKFQIDKSLLVHEIEQILVESEGLAKIVSIVNPPFIATLCAPFRECVEGETLRLYLCADAVEEMEAKVTLRSLSREFTQTIKLPFRGDLQFSPKYDDSTYSIEVHSKDVFLGGLEGIKLHKRKRIIIWSGLGHKTELSNEKEVVQAITTAKPGSTLLIGFSSLEQLLNVATLAKSEYQVYASEDVNLCRYLAFTQPFRPKNFQNVQKSVLLLSSTALDEYRDPRELLEKIHIGEKAILIVLTTLSIFESLVADFENIPPVIDVLRVPFKETVDGSSIDLRLKISHPFRDKIRLVSFNERLNVSSEQSIEIPCDGTYAIEAKGSGVCSIEAYYGMKLLARISDVHISESKSFKLWKDGLESTLRKVSDVKSLLEQESARYIILAVPSLDTVREVLRTLPIVTDQKEKLLSDVLENSCGILDDGLRQTVVLTDLSERNLRVAFHDMTRGKFIICPQTSYERIIRALERVRASSSSERPSLVITRTVHPARTIVGDIGRVDCIVTSLEGDAFHLKLHPETMMIPEIEIDYEGILFREQLKKGESMSCNFSARFLSQGRLRLPALTATFEDMYGVAGKVAGHVDFVDVVPRELFDFHGVELVAEKNSIKTPHSESTKLEIRLVNSTPERLSNVTLHIEPKDLASEDQRLYVDVAEGFSIVRFCPSVISPARDGVYTLRVVCEYNTLVPGFSDCGLRHSKELQVQVTVVSPHLTYYRRFVESYSKTVLGRIPFGTKFYVEVTIKNEADLTLSNLSVTEKLTCDRSKRSRSFNLEFDTIAPFQTASCAYDMMADELGLMQFSSIFHIVDEFGKTHTMEGEANQLEIVTPHLNIDFYRDVTRIMDDFIIVVGLKSPKSLPIRIISNSDKLEGAKIYLQSERKSFEVTPSVAGIDLSRSVELPIQLRGLNVIYRRIDIETGFNVKLLDSLICKVRHEKSGAVATRKMPVAVFPSTRCITCFPSCKKTRFDPRTCPLV